MKDEAGKRERLATEVARLRRLMAEHETTCDYCRARGGEKAEKTFQESEIGFRLLFEKSADPALILDGETFIDCNEAALKLLKCSAKDSLIGLRPFDISPKRQPDGRLSLYKARQNIGVALERGSHRLEWVHCDFDGREIWLDVSLTAIPFQGRQVIYTVWKDISERKRAEEQLVKSEGRYRGLFETMLDGFAAVNMDKRIVEANPALQQMVGYTQEELLRLSYEDVTPEKWHVFEENIVHGQVLTRGYSDLYEKEYLRKDGTTIPVELRVHLLRDELGNPSEMWGFIRDISERQRRKEALLESEERYRKVVHLSPVGIFIHVGGRIEFANPAFAHMLGARSPEGLYGRHVLDFVHPDYAGIVRERIECIMVDKKITPFMEQKFVRLDGLVIDVQVTGSPFKYRGRDGAMVAAADITRQKQTEEELKHRERELEDKSVNLEEANAALRALLRHRDEDKKTLESTILANITELVLPYIKKLRSKNLTDNQSMYLTIVESNLKEIISPFLQKMTAIYAHFTPMEIQIADLIKSGKTSKEIAEFLNIGSGTVHSHRNNIRSKLGLNNKDINLRTFLLSLQD
ncbi:MAG: PAS domain S-box protein [Syntrophorhabdales bacterium]|jgi:PAS domain S-box-containing protein